MALDRFETKFTKHENGCWLWNAARRTTGYGVFSFNGKPQTASRVSYILYHGVDPGDLHVCHTCDNPACVNPEHLFLGTNKDNVEDRKSKGRPAGRYSVLTKDEHDRILEFIESHCDLSLREIARQLGESRMTVQRISKGKLSNKFKKD